MFEADVFANGHWIKRIIVPSHEIAAMCKTLVAWLKEQRLYRRSGPIYSICAAL